MRRMACGRGLAEGSWRRLVRAVLLVALGLQAAAGWLAAQQRVGGVVVDATTRRPLPGAQVVVQGTELGAVTDNRGRFLILNVPGDRVTLQVVMIGYGELAETVQTGRTDVVLAVTETAISLDEIVVTGTPQQELVRSLGNAVGGVRAEALVEIAPPPNVQQLLGVAVPGVRVMAAGGDVGSGGNIRIRGAGSMALPSEPLVYVDGVRVNNSFADQGIVSGVGVDGRYPPSRINDLNLEDIESIEVIKGPAAATLYGTEASNGVINIITKKGRRGSPTVSLTVKRGRTGCRTPRSSFRRRTTRIRRARLWSSGCCGVTG